MFRIFAGLSHTHFVGIGGAGMSGIAEVLLDYDLEVSGCDQAQSATTRRLEDLGVKVHRGHSVDHLDGVDLVVKSSAIADDNVEIVAARERGIAIIMVFVKRTNDSDRPSWQGHFNRLSIKQF